MFAASCSGGQGDSAVLDTSEAQGVHDITDSVDVTGLYVISDPASINVAIRFMDLEGKEQWLRDHHDPVLSDCAEGCRVAIIPPVTLIEPGAYGHGKELEDRVDFQVGLCPIEAPDCSYEDFLDEA